MSALMSALSRTSLRALCVLLVAAACRSAPEEPTTVVKAGAARDTPGLELDEATQLVRATDRAVGQYEELRLQGMTQQMVALRRTIARSVDDHLDTFRTMALEGDLVLQRNMAVKCIAFAMERRTEARETLEILLGDASPTLVANAVVGLGVLGDPETDLTPIIALLAHRDVGIRTNAATALIHLFRVIPTPRELPAQYYAAIERLAVLLHEPSSSRARRAAAWALANMQHPEVLDHLVSALQDDDEQVQVGGLYGLKLLGDQRGIEPVLEYLDGGPTTQGASWARQALESIVIRTGLAEDASELAELEANPRQWRRWIRDARMR